MGESALKKCKNFLYKGAIGVVMLGISMFLCWRFIYYIKEKIEDESSFVYYLEASLFLLTYFMALWSLAKTFFGNPGYVKDYFWS